MFSNCQFKYKNLGIYASLLKPTITNIGTLHRNGASSTLFLFCVLLRRTEMVFKHIKLKKHEKDYPLHCVVY